MTTGARESIKKYVAASLQYLANAQQFLSRGEAGKASELLWGSMVEAIQAVAAHAGIHLANHRSLRYFVSKLAKERNDRTLTQSFHLAELLHSNFHEVEFEPEDVATMVDPIRETVAKLLALIPQEVFQEKDQGDTHA